MSVVGLDVGTSRVKAVRFDDSWQAVDAADAPTKVAQQPGGGREQELPEVWDAAADVVAAVVERSPDAVDLLAVTAQGDGCWLVDSDLEPAGPALLWNDSRAAPIVDAWHRDGTLERAFRISGCYGAPGLAHAQLRWLAEHDPDVVRRADVLLSCGSWVFANLTGRAVLDETDAANPFFGAAERAYAPELLDIFDIDAFARLLPPAVRDSERVAPLRPEAAARVGLRAGTPVALAPYDVAATAIGTGTVRPGDAFAVLGTTLCVGVVRDDPALDRPANGMTLPGATDGRWLLAYATLSGTEVLDWLARLVGAADAGAAVRLASESEHPQPPLLLPYLSPAGERSPFLDPAVRGTLTGLELAHTPADVARGVLDGLTLAVADCLAAAGAARTLALCGGGARSDLWCQAISDATGVPVVRAAADEVGALGAVLVGAVADGRLPDVDTAVGELVRPGRRHEPDPERGDYYRGALARLRTERDALRPG